MITYNWSVTSLKVVPEQNGFQNVVRYVRWNLTATLDNTETSTIGICSLKNPVDNFVKFEALTEAQVVEWVHIALGNQRKQHIEQSLYNKLLSSTSTQIVSMPLPWQV